MFTCLSSNLWLNKKWFRKLQQDGDLPHSGQNQPFLQAERSSLLQPGHWRGGGVCHAHHQLINEIVIMITSIIITTVMRYLQHHHYYCHRWMSFYKLCFFDLLVPSFTLFYSKDVTVLPKHQSLLFYSFHSPASLPICLWNNYRSWASWRPQLINSTHREHYKILHCSINCL